MASSGYMIPLIVRTEADIIVAPGFYRTRSGERVEITAVSTRHDFGCVGSYDNGTPEGWHKSGRLFAGVESANDIVSVCGGS